MDTGGHLQAPRVIVCVGGAQGANGPSHARPPVPPSVPLVGRGRSMVRMGLMPAVMCSLEEPKLNVNDLKATVRRGCCSGRLSHVCCLFTEWLPLSRGIFSCIPPRGGLRAIRLTRGSARGPHCDFSWGRRGQEGHWIPRI